MAQYLKDNPKALDPETIHLLSGVLDDAWDVVEANETAFMIDGDAGAARRTLAKHIVEFLDATQISRRSMSPLDRNRIEREMHTIWPQRPR